MSRSNVLADRKHEFRDKAKLLGAMFRVSSKADLLADSTLEKILRRLAQHRPDAIRVARFLRSWEVGLDSAKDRFLTGIRRLDLSDYVQVQQVLLNFEGQPLGSYLLDVFDRVLQHEIEGDQDTISAAEELNDIATNSYPVPYIASSADLQDLVYRVIWQHPRRLKVKTTECDVPVGFGDVLIRNERLNEAATEAAPVDNTKSIPVNAACNPKKDVQPEAEVDAFVVMTPACDLTREEGAVRILLLAGRLAEMTPKTWNYKDNGFKTPIIELPGDRRLWIKWDPKDLRMLLPSEISEMLGEAGSFNVVLRLRESNALEIQQRLLSNMGRVGLLAQMPATFSVAVEARYLDASGNMVKFNTPTLDREGGVCFTGRDSEGNHHSRLVLTGQVIDELMTELSLVNEQSISPRARETFKRLQASKGFGVDLQRGLKVPPPGGVYQQIKCVTDNGDNKAEVVGQIARDPKDDAVPEQKFSAFVLVLRGAEEISGTS